MALYKNKYRIEPARMKGWDYGSDAPYFITICTREKEPFFGRIVEGKMKLLEVGVIAQNCWNEIPKYFPFVILDAFVVMPNHLHGILLIDKQEDISDGDGNKVNQGNGDAINRRDGDAINRVSTRKNGGTTGTNNPMNQQNLGRIIRWYKGRVTFESRKINPDFAWQARFHDHIIRNQKSFRHIQDYIENNPLNWQEDKFFYPL